MDTIGQWKDSPAVTPKLSDDSAMPKGDELKLSPDNMRIYLNQTSQSYPAGGLITALVAEGSLDKQGVAKPSDLYFTAGQQKFLYMVRQILSNTSQDDVAHWTRGAVELRKQTSLPWLGCRRRSAVCHACPDPSSEAKLTNPGSESMAVLGLSMHPVFAGRNRTLTQGCSGLWSKSKYSWPLWGKPASPRAVKSLACLRPVAGGSLPLASLLGRLQDSQVIVRIWAGRLWYVWPARGCMAVTIELWYSQPAQVHFEFAASIELMRIPPISTGAGRCGNKILQA